MVNIAANMTQVLSNSPQVTTLVAGEAGALEQIKRQKQVEESRRFEEDMRSKVLSTEKTLRPGEAEAEARRRLEEGPKVPPVTRREGRRGARRRPEHSGGHEGAMEASPSSAASNSPFEISPVIDLCV